LSRPRILITLDHGQELRRGVPFPTVLAKEAYVGAVERAGGVPLLVAPTGEESLAALGELLDGLVVTGGAFDIEPERYGRAREAGRLDPPKPARTQFEAALLERALARRRPVLGVCGGMQLLNVVRGGSLFQDIRQALGPTALDHEQPTSPAEGWHELLPAPGGLLDRLMHGRPCSVNSTHHQAVDCVGAGLEILAKSKDGVIEAIGMPGEAFVVGVQWHPELQDDALSRALYRGLVEAALAE
jgi:putative glutamine amidotransferase